MDEEKPISQGRTLGGEPLGAKPPQNVVDYGDEDESESDYEIVGRKNFAQVRFKRFCPFPRLSPSPSPFVFFSDHNPVLPAVIEF
jgi:hypothetical protein